MSTQNEELASLESPNSQQELPVGPETAPEGTPAPATQEQVTETPEQLAARKAYFQTQAQQEKARADAEEARANALEADLNELKSRLANPGYETFMSPPSAPVMGNPTAPAIVPDQLPEGVDPISNPAGYARYLADITVRAAMQAQNQANTEAQTKRAVAQFNKFIQDHQIPENLRNEAWQEYWRRLSTPEGAVTWMAEYIVQKAKLERQNMDTTRIQQEAAEKGKALLNVQNPTPGTPVAPIPVQSDEEKLRNLIAPDTRSFKD